MDLNNSPLWTAVITPMLENGDVDYVSLEALLKQQEEARNGILILGSTGEALNLGQEEMQKILDFTVGLKLQVPLMCGVGGINLEQTAKWVTYLETLPLDAYLMVTPLYAKPGDEGQYEWFKTLMDLSSRPVMLYNVPSRTGTSLSLKAVKRLNTHKNFWAVKEASGSVEDFKKYVEASGEGRVYSGDDGMLPDFSQHNCSGLVSVAANAWPLETHLYVELTLKQKLDDPKLWQECSDSLFIASNPIPVKALMASRGTIKTNILRAPLTHLDLTDLTPLNTAQDRVEKWFKLNS
ncbi:MAG: 4-hydroxy-tetrahydrodipicolinate synthase [Bacteriovoracaceae bacterium]|nr:4-hydroxy-tetrahydrodipicolinate synthase [Bacteriovoracaceae bacterium]